MAGLGFRRGSYKCVRYIHFFFSLNNIFYSIFFYVLFVSWEHRSAEKDTTFPMSSQNLNILMEQIWKKNMQNGCRYVDFHHFYSMEG